MRLGTLISMMNKIPVFDPNTMSNLQNRFETSGLTGYADGSAVSSLPDLKGSATCTSNNNVRPLYRASGRYLEFDGTDDRLTTNITNAFGDFAVVMVVRFRNLTTTAQRAMDKGYDTGFWLGTSTTTTGGIGGGVRENASPYGSFQTASANTWYVIVLERNGTTKRIRIGGTQTTSTVSNTATSTNPIAFGATYDGVHNWGAIDLKAAFVFHAALSSTDDANLASYISRVYGLTY